MHYRRSFCLALAGAAFACAPPTHMDTSVDQVPDANRGLVELVDQASPPTAAIDGVIENFIAGQGAMGCAVGITEGGSMAYLQAYGEREPGQPFTVHTRSAVGSISKTMTAIAAMRLVEMGEMSLNTSFTDVVPHWPLPAAYANATLEDLLSHRSGVQYWPDWAYGSEANTRATLNMFYGPEDESGALPRKAVWALDGAQTVVGAGVYSNLGYLMVAAMIDAVVTAPGFAGYPAGLQYEPGYESWVWTVLNRNDDIDMWSSALNHIWREDGDLEEFAEDPSAPAWGYFGWEAGPGGWTMTIGDLARLSMILRDEEKVSGATWADMKTSRGNLNLGIASPMGLGVILRTRMGGRAAVGHDGGIRGYQASVYYVPSEDVGVALFCNDVDGSIPNLADSVGLAWISQGGFGGGGIGVGGFGGDSAQTVMQSSRSTTTMDRLIDDPAGPQGVPLRPRTYTPVPRVTVEPVDPAVARVREAYLDDLMPRIRQDVERYGILGARLGLEREVSSHPQGQDLIRAALEGDAVQFANCLLRVLEDRTGSWTCP